MTTKKTHYVVRSMTTTDYAPQYGQYPQPYHIYLMPAHKRVRAYWGSIGQAQIFETVEEAQVEIARSLPVRDRLNARSYGPDIAPFDHERTGHPTFWALQSVWSAFKYGRRVR